MHGDRVVVRTSGRAVPKGASSASPARTECGLHGYDRDADGMGYVALA